MSGPTLGLTRAEYLRKAAQHDNAAYLAFSSVVLPPSDPEMAARLWKRRDEYFELARATPAPERTEP